MFFHLLLFSLSVTAHANELASDRDCPELPGLEQISDTLDQVLPLALPQVERYVDRNEEVLDQGTYERFIIPLIARRFLRWAMFPVFRMQLIMALLYPSDIGGNASKDWKFIQNPFKQLHPERWEISREELCTLHSNSPILVSRTQWAHRFVEALLTDYRYAGEEYILTLPPDSL